MQEVLPMLWEVSFIDDSAFALYHNSPSTSPSHPPSPSAPIMRSSGWTALELLELGSAFAREAGGQQRRFVRSWRVHALAISQTHQVIRHPKPKCTKSLLSNIAAHHPATSLWLKIIAALSSWHVACTDVTRRNTSLAAAGV